MKSQPSLRYLLLQVRNPDDPMREHEVKSFVRVLQTLPERIRIVDLLSRCPTRREMDETDMVLLGGSGHYSAAEEQSPEPENCSSGSKLEPSRLRNPDSGQPEAEWLERALDTMRQVHGMRTPTFASCWGFQAMARALGGRVTRDLSRAEVGTHPLFLTEAGKADPVFGPLGDTFYGQMGHEDSVIERPEGTTLLASSARVENQAYRFEDAPIYCTQFHPELNCDDLLLRVTHYPEYIERIAGLPPERFPEMIHETPETERLLHRFIHLVFGD